MKTSINLKNGIRRPTNKEATLLVDECTRKVTLIVNGHEYTFDDQDSSELKKLQDAIDDFIDKGEEFGCDLMTFTPHLNLNVGHGIIYDDLSGLSDKEPVYWSLKIDL